MTCYLRNWFFQTISILIPFSLFLQQSAHPPNDSDIIWPPSAFAHPSTLSLWHSSTLDLWQPSTLCTYDTHPPSKPTLPPPCAHDTHLHSPLRRSSLRSRCRRRTDTRRGCTAPSADTRIHPPRTRSRRALQQTNHMEQMSMKNNSKLSFK